MSVGLYRTAVAMVGQERRLDAIAANLANVGTVGFKRSATATHEFEVAVARGKSRGISIRTEVDFSQGELKRTGHEYDLALWGEGFFTIEGPEGEVYTRDGSFQVTPDGVLVSGDGWPVAWESRGASIDPTEVPITVASDGSVSQGSNRLGQLKVVNFVDNSRLQQASGGYWKAPPLLEEATHTSTVHQGALEQSNAAGMDEMIAMIGVQRSFESAAKVLSSIEESYRRLTRPF